MTGVQTCALPIWLRIALRRLRYLAEDFAPVLGEPAERLRKRAHAVERLVARIRDASLALDRFDAEDPPPPSRLRRPWHRERKEAIGALDKAWAKFAGRTFRRELADALPDRS